MFEKHFLVFCNVNNDGDIVDGLTGNNIIPSKQYDHFFYLGEEGIDDLMGYKVVNGELIKVEKQASEINEKDGETEVVESDKQ